MLQSDFDEPGWPTCARQSMAAQNGISQEQWSVFPWYNACTSDLVLKTSLLHTNKKNAIAYGRNDASAHQFKP